MKAQDLIREEAHLFLGSRLKRLADRLQADVARVAARAGLAVQPSQYAVLGTIDKFGPQTISALSHALGISQPAVTRIVSKLESSSIVSVTRGTDRRQKTVALTEIGETIMLTSRTAVWPQVEGAVRGLLADLNGPFMEDLASIEARLSERSFDLRARDVANEGLSIVEFSDELGPMFGEINGEWIQDMYVLEESDQRVLSNPRTQIIDPGGVILFVKASGLGIVGTCALKRTAEGEYELTKMGVLARARGRKAGEFLLAAVIERARELGARRLYLLTNKKSEAGIHLYEKLGFRHDAGIMSEFGSIYKRCNVAMLYCGNLALPNA